MAWITDYSFGAVKVAGRTHSRDLVVCGEQVLSPWELKEGHRLFLEDLSWTLALQPRVMIVGTGAFGRLHISKEVVKCIDEMRISLHGFKSRTAINDNNETIDQEEDIIACLCLSC